VGRDQTSRETTRPKQEINPTTKSSTEKCCITGDSIVLEEWRSNSGEAKGNHNCLKKSDFRNFRSNQFPLVFGVATGSLNHGSVELSAFFSWLILNTISYFLFGLQELNALPPFC
jgi:hypothetical protein